MKPRKSIGIYFTPERAHLVCVKRSIGGEAIQSEGSFALSAPEIGAFIKNAGFSGAPVFAAVSRDQALTLMARLPEAAGENLAETLGFELDRLTPFGSGEALFAYRVAGNDEERGAIKVYLSVLPKAVFERYRAVLEEIPAATVSLELSDGALARAAARLAPGSCEDSIVVASSGGQALAAALSGGGLAGSRSASSDGEGGLEALVSDVRRSAGPGGADTGKACVFGPGADSLRAAGWDVATPDVPSPAEVAVLDPALRAIAYGAALDGAAEPEAGTNLLRDSGLKCRAASSWGPATGVLAAAVCALLLAVLFTPFLTAYVRYMRVERRLEAMRPAVEKIENIKKKTAELTARKAQLERFGGGEYVVLGLLRELALKLPEDTWLTEFSLDGNDIKLGGLSRSSSSLIPLLEASGFMEKVEFASSITMTDGSSGSGIPGAGPSLAQGKKLERFTIKALLEGPA